jgi:DNA invertase Pin-like site-specific DNA recombinase
MEDALATYFYARISTRQQDPRSQVEAARARGIPAGNIIVEVASGAKNDRPKLNKLLAQLKAGDVLASTASPDRCTTCSPF